MRPLNSIFNIEFSVCDISYQQARELNPAPPIDRSGPVRTVTQSPEPSRQVGTAPRFLDLNPVPDEFQNLMVTSLSNETSLIKFS